MLNLTGLPPHQGQRSSSLIDTVSGVFIMRHLSAFFFLLLSFPLYAFGPSLQLITVTTKEWNSIQGVLQRYERSQIKDSWKKKGDPIEVVMGKNGLAFENGKREGDGKSPSGIFSLGTGFGYSPFPEAKIKYLKSLPSHECVDDVKSIHYNQIIDRKTVKAPDWKSSEQMKRGDDLYKLGIVVNHNTKDPVPSGGSCIFLHIWRNDATGTAGCTAMKEKNMKELLSWVDESKNPLLVQLPEEDYEKKRKLWDLP